MTVLRHLAFWRHSENPRQSRLLRRAGNLLLITGGLVLAYRSGRRATPPSSRAG